MTYRVPVEEQRFVLRHVAGLPDLATHPRFAAASPDVVDAILDGAAAFAEGEFAPLNHIGDAVGAVWTDGVVKMPPGFCQAYDGFIAGGWGTLAGPEVHGGQAMPFALANAVFESLGGANMAFGLITMLTAGAIEALAAHGSIEQGARWLPRLISGEWNGTMNLTEPQAGSDLGAIRTMASPAPDGSWRVVGQKIFITFGEHDLTANIVHLVLARTPDAPAGTRGLSLFLVPKYRLDAAGNAGAFNDVRCASIEHKLGIHGSPTCTMVFGDDGDCHGELVGELHGGMKAMFTMMNAARISVGCQGVQIAEAATQRALAFASERIQSAAIDSDGDRRPVPIDRHPDVRRMLRRMQALTQAARALVYYAAGLVDRAHLGDPAARARLALVTPLAKAWSSDVGCEVASLGIQVHGGMGFIEETGAAQHWRDARIAPIYEGTNGIQAIDLVLRKLRGDGGVAFRALLDEIDAASVGGTPLARLSCLVRNAGQWMLAGDDLDRRLELATPFSTMLATLIAGWLLDHEASAAASGMGDDFLTGKREVRQTFDRVIRESSALVTAEDLVG